MPTITDEPEIKTAGPREGNTAVNATTVDRSDTLTPDRGKYDKPRKKRAAKLWLKILFAVLSVVSIKITVDVSGLRDRAWLKSSDKAQITLPSQFAPQPRTVVLKAVIPKLRPGYSPFAVTRDSEKKFYIHPGTLEGKRFTVDEHLLGVNEFDGKSNDTGRWFDVWIYEAKPSDVIEGGPYDYLPPGRFISDPMPFQRRALKPGEK
jgi:hypothetical protein